MPTLNDTTQNLEALSFFQSLLQNKRFEIHYQPIFSLQDKKVFGYESLTRFQNNPYFYHPGELFDFAYHSGHLYELEKITRELAIQQIKPYLKKDETLWINLTPHVVYDSGFSTGYTRRLLDYFDLSANQVIFEITERSAITNFSAFKHALEHYRKQGFKIAIDDAGAGYSSLEAITELQPDYIKIDRSLISNIHNSLNRQYILEALLQMSNKIKATVIAEGVETKEELRTVSKLGVPLVQGFYLARPTFPPPTVMSYKHEEINLSRPSSVPCFVLKQDTTYREILCFIQNFDGRMDFVQIKLKSQLFQETTIKELIQFVCYLQLTNHGNVPLDLPILQSFLKFKSLG